MTNIVNTTAQIEECVETLSMGHVTKRKVFGFKGLIWFSLGIAALVAQTFDKENGSTTMALLMFGLSLSVYGLIVFLVKKEHYFYNQKTMKMREFLFDQTRFSDVMCLYNDCNFGAMLNISRTSASKMKLKVLFATDYSVAFSQIFKFVDYDFTPVEPVRQHDTSQCATLGKLVAGY